MFVLLWSDMSTDLCQLPVLPFIRATCCMEEHKNQKLYNEMKYRSFDGWIGSIKAALCREGKVKTTPFQHKWLCHGNNTSSQFILSLYLCPPLPGCCQRTCWSWCPLSCCSLRSLPRPHPRARGRCRRKGHSERGRRTARACGDSRMKRWRFWSHEKVCVWAHRRHYLRPEVAPGGESGLCWSCQSLSLILIVSSGASRHTKIQLMDKSIRALKIQHFISAWLLRKMSANTFGCSFPLTAQSKDGFNSETDLIHSSSYFRAKIHIWTSGVCNRSADHSFIRSRNLNLYLVMHIHHFSSCFLHLLFGSCILHCTSGTFSSLFLLPTCPQMPKSNTCSRWWTSSQ